MDPSAKAAIKTAALAGLSFSLSRLSEHFSPSNYDEEGRRVQTTKLVVVSEPEVPRAQGEED